MSIQVFLHVGPNELFIFIYIRVASSPKYIPHGEAFAWLQLEKFQETYKAGFMWETLIYAN